MTTEAPKKDIAAKRKTLPELLNDEATRKRFEGMLGKDARSFAQNILTVWNGNDALQKCEPESIIAAAAISASINLSVLTSLGFSCIVPYDGVAQWQLMSKGVIQLAQRSKRYVKINLARVYDGELVGFDKFKGVVVLDEKKKKSGRVEGYYFYFKLNDGYEHEAYWSAHQCVEHGLRFSKSFQSGKGQWAEDSEFARAGSVKKWLDAKEHFLTEGSGADAMAAKTIVKNVLLKWGPLETRVQEVMSLDQAVIGADGKPTYIDTTAEPATPAKDYTAPPMAKPGQKPPAGERIAWTRADTIKKGIPAEQFEAWLGAQPGEPEAVADAAEAEWKRMTLAKNEGKEYAAFALKTAAQDDANAPAKEQAAEFAEFKVHGVAESEFNNEPAYCIRDTSDPVMKYFTDNDGFAEAAKAAKKADKKLAVNYIEKTAGKKAFRWITRID